MTWPEAVEWVVGNMLAMSDADIADAKELVGLLADPDEAAHAASALMELIENRPVQTIRLV